MSNKDKEVMYIYIYVSNIYINRISRTQKKHYVVRFASKKQF